MTRATATLCLAAGLSWTLGVSAQTQPSDRTDRPQTEARTQARATASTVTLIGCLEPGTANQFVLNVIEHPGAAATQAQRQTITGTGRARVGETEVGISGRADIEREQTAGTAGTSLVGQRVQLIGTQRTLRAHAGHKVEITGTMTPRATARGREQQQPAAEMRLNVRNVRMLAGTCEPVTGTAAGAATAAPSQTRSQPSQAQTQPRTATTPSQRQPQPAIPGRTETQRPVGGTMTLIGCLEPSTGNVFALNVVEVPGVQPRAQARSRAGAQAQAQVGTGGVDLIGQRVELTTTAQMDLRAHTGHKIEITGMLLPPGTTPPAGHPVGNQMRLNVTNMRHIATTCTPARDVIGGTGATPAQPATPAEPPRR